MFILRQPWRKITINILVINEFYHPLHSRKRPKNNLDLDFGVFGFENHSHSPNPLFGFFGAFVLLLSFWGLDVCVLASCVASCCAHLCYSSRPYHWCLSALASGLQGTGSGRGPQVSRQRLTAEGLQTSFVPIAFVDTWMLSIIFLSSVKLLN